MRTRLLPAHGERGFTLIEVMVALVIGTLIIGGVMGLVSASLQFSTRIKEKSAIQPVLESAADLVLSNPDLLDQGSIRMESFPDVPVVQVSAEPVETSASRFGRDHSKHLFRVQLRYMGHMLEFSMVVTEQQVK
jgi:prepilin-type N-terminal cleavage/methylation domain-containing protein